jgi:hypothetical protein
MCGLNYLFIDAGQESKMASADKPLARSGPVFYRIASVRIGSLAMVRLREIPFSYFMK